MIIQDYQFKKVADFLREEKPKRVALVFWHGLGDLIMFLEPLAKLRQMFPETEIRLAIQKGVGQEELVEDAIVIDDGNKPIEGYDYSFAISFPMSEHLQGLKTKGEFCCELELGIEPPDRSHPIWGKNYSHSLFVGCNFQATALPWVMNPEPTVARKIWDEIKEVGFIPIETTMIHTWFNPVNQKYDFIDRHVRDFPASIPFLIRLMQNCLANICVSSGNLHVALAVNPDRTLFLKKAHGIECYTRLLIEQVDVGDYREGTVKEWLKRLGNSVIR